jgi:tRNA(fMet)-specific endonuclease VapC
MTFLLDTDICSAHIRRPAGLMHRFVQYTGRIIVPTLVMAELYVWAYMRVDPGEFLSAITTFLDYDIEVIGFDEASAEQFGRLKVSLQRIGMTMTPIDMLIASVALAHDLTLMTHNTADFQNVPNLGLDDWLKS